jgi:hypothetical protein
MHDKGFSIGRSDFFHRFGQPFIVDVRQHYPHPLRSKGRCRSSADAACCSCDDSNAPVQVGDHDVPS